MDLLKLQSSLQKIDWNGLITIQTSKGLVQVPVTAYDNLETVYNRIVKAGVKL